jgi:hypothetical protein
MTPLARATAQAFGSLKTAAGEPISYAANSPPSGMAATIALSAVRGRSTMVTGTGAGGMIEALSADFIVSAHELAIAGVPYTPAEGDRITAVEDASQYQVLSPPFTFSDHAGERLRIHTKRIVA